MHGTTAFTAVAAAMAAIGQAAKAPETSDNPPKVIYKAVVEKPFFTDADLPGELVGSITAQAPSDGEGVKFLAHFENLPDRGGPFTYHLHLKAVPEDGNCTAAATHLDPYGAGAETPCDASAPETCEVGDLSGKHGAISEAPFHAEYVDAYAATKEGSESFFGDLSFVLHYQNKTRLACANFIKEDASTAPYPTGGTNTTTVSVLPTGTGAPTYEHIPTPSGPPASSGARLSVLSINAMLFGVVAVVLGT